LPESALRAEGKKWAIKAIKTFEPGRGIKLSTHVTNYLQRVRRLNYQYQNVARLPESKQLQFREYNEALNQLAEDIGRNPTDEELATHLGWGKKNTVKYGKMVFKDFLESQGEDLRSATHYTINKNKIFFKELEKQLTEEEMKLYKLKRAGVTENAKLQAAMGDMPLSTLSYWKASLNEKILKNKGLLEA
jgi:DNA-directed RNA polymerase specialized sigma subunit